MRRALDPGAATVAAAAFVWHVVLMTTATNDNFMHMAMAQQWLAGDWPVRDFFDNGSLLQYSLSALALRVVGDRLLGEALVVGLTWAVSAYLVFVLVRRLTNALPAAWLASLLLIVAGARGYSYPKGIIYAVAAVLWWAYVARPRTAIMVASGVWVAVAYFWRPDHGVYTAVGVVLAALAAHGIRREAMTRVLLAGATTLALVIPFWIYIEATAGFANYARASMAGLETEHETHGTHVWPLLRFRRDLITTRPAEGFAPTIGIRWSAQSSPEARQAVRQRYGLTEIEHEGASERDRMSAQSIANIRPLLGEAIVEDTAGIDRSASTLEKSRWPLLQRLKFKYAWLRVQVLPQLDERERAAEFAVAVFLALPLLVLIASRWIAPRLAAGVTPWQLFWFALFAFVVGFAMLRQPFTARVADAVVLCAVTFGISVVWLWRVGAGSVTRAMVTRVTAVGLSVITMVSVADAGQFGRMMDSLTRHWRSNPIAGVWASIDPELTSAPPLANYVDRRARITLRLAAYARGCVPPTERVLVLWFEPEIPYFSERLLAQQHLVFPSSWGSLPHEQQATLAKVSRYKPPIAFALASALERTARPAFPVLVDYVAREYQRAATVEDGGEEYLIFTRKDRQALGRFGPQGWPCFVRDPSPWDRVGVPAD